MNCCKTLTQKKNFDRFGLGRVTDERIPGQEAVEKHSKLMVLGKPGAGKTTFLKHLAIQCNQGNFQDHCVPTFITLKQFAEAEEKPSLLEYITQIFADCDISSEQIAVLLKQGKLLILLDGLDEVKAEDNSRVIKQVLDFSENFRRNKFVITCRIAAKTCNFEKFTEVEVADFDWEQISTFAQNWFKLKNLVNANEFIQEIKQNSRIRELVTNPLLLTLLCLVFEDSLKFPANRSELYEEGINILLKKWDETRNIERDQVYKYLSLQRKKDLLSQMALTTFERGDYFFKQKELEQYISDYIHNLPDAQDDPEALQLDSEAVLKSIEAQHGLLVERAQKIYSFSHLTFQEYFTALKIVINCNSYSPDQEDWQIFISKITDKRWREVLLLVVEMLPSADFLLLFIKQQIDRILAIDEKLQQFLSWINQKSCSVPVPFKKNAVRAFYFDVSLSYPEFESEELVISLQLSLKLDSNFEFFDEPELNNVDLELDYCLYTKLKNAVINRDFGSLDPGFFPNINCDFNLWKSLEKLDKYIPDFTKNNDLLNEALVNNWIDKLRSLMIKYRNIGYNWQFNEEQNKLLKKYSDANKLLVDCLNSGCNVSPNVRDEIEQTLLLPISEINPR